MAFRGYITIPFLLLNCWTKQKLINQSIYDLSEAGCTTNSVCLLLI